MTENVNKIISFITPTGRSASEITQELSELGGGSMENGLNIVAKYFMNENVISKNKGIVKGMGIGSLGTMGFIGLGYLAYNNWSKIKSYASFLEDHEIEETAIVTEIDKLEEARNKEDDSHNEKIN